MFLPIRLTSLTLCAGVILCYEAACLSAEWPALLGRDRAGLPLECGTLAQDLSGASRVVRMSAASLPAGTRAWEVIPGVVRSDGSETFRLEVNVNGPVQSVVLFVQYPVLAAGPGPHTMKDDGTGQDRVAGDFIFTAGPFSINPTNLEVQLSGYGSGGRDNLTGQNFFSMGFITITELGGSQWNFIIQPDIGVLSTNVSPALSERFSTNVAASPHLVNVVTDSAAAQIFLRYREADNRLPGITRPFFDTLGSRCDFIILLSTYRLERQDLTRTFVAGTHLTVKRNYTGTGAPPFDDTATYGSNSNLLSINLLDAGYRGIVAKHATHELLHQWAAYISPSLRLGDGVHYYNWSSVPSVLGGFPWIDLGGGMYRRDCNGDGANGAHQVASLDKYMMGLIDAAQVEPIHWEEISFPINCNNPITGVKGQTTIQDIISLSGPRSPGPAQAQRSFRIAFVIESNSRFLTSNEMTFYERLAEHYTRKLPVDGPLPFVEFNWVPITRFFGNDTAWDSSIADVRLRIKRLSGTLLELRVEDVFNTARYRIESTDVPGPAAWEPFGVLQNSSDTLLVTNVNSPAFFRAIRIDSLNPE